MAQESLKHPFVFHRPNADQASRITKIREALKGAYEIVLENAPSSAERTLAVRKLEEASMWANKAIVMEQGTPVDASQSPRSTVTADQHYDQNHFALATAEGMPEPPNH